MATIAELLVKIGANSSGLRKELAATQRQLKRAFGPEALAMSEKAAGLLGILATAITAVGTASVITAGKMDQSAVAFETLIGNAQEAKSFLSDLAQFAAETPFEFEGLQDTAKKLLAFKFAAQDIIPIMNTIGDAAGMLGSGQQGIERMTLAISQMQAKGRVMGQELLQLAEAGVNAYQYLADSMGKSIPEVMKAVEKGQVSASEGINAILLGMQKDFQGGMEKQAKTIPGLWSTILDNTKIVMQSAGNDLIKALGITEKMQWLADTLSDFAARVKQVGIGQALKEMIPPQLSASIFAVAGALTAAAIPAMVKFGASVWSAIAPLIPFLAIGAAVGLLGYAIWKGWEPLATLFSGLWQTITGSAKWAWALIQKTVLGALSNILSKIDWVFKALGVKNPFAGFTESINNSLKSATDNFNAAKNEIGSGYQKIIEGSKGFGSAMVTEFNRIKDGAKTIKKEFTGLSNTPVVKAGPTEAELKKIEDKAKQVSDSIEREWIQVTKTEQEQLDIWRQEQLDALNETKNANKNYLRDVARVNDIYTEKSKKIAENEAKKKQYELDKIKDKVKQISDSIEREWVQTTKTELDQLDIWKSEQIAALDETKAANENYQRDLERVEAVYSQRRLKILEDEREKAKNLWSEQLTAARDNGDIAGYMNLLNTERALFQQDLAGRQAMIDQYYQYWKETHRSAMDYMAEAMGGLYSGLENFFVDILNNAKNVGEAWQSLKNAVLAMIGQMVAKWMASQIMMKVFGQTMQSTLAAASVATAGSISAAWAPAAAMVSLATMGANAGPAMSGIAATTALSEGLARIPALAEGGITTGPTIAEIGEGRYKEAVLPLNKKYFEKAGLIGGHQEQQPIIFSPTIKALDSSDVESWLENGGGAKFEKYFRRRGRSFVEV